MSRDENPRGGEGRRREEELAREMNVQREGCARWQTSDRSDTEDTFEWSREKRSQDSLLSTSATVVPAALVHVLTSLYLTSRTTSGNAKISEE